MSVRVLGHRPDQVNRRRGDHAQPAVPSRMDPGLLELALSQTETIERMRAGNPRHQAQEPVSELSEPVSEPTATPAPKPKSRRKGNRRGRPGTAVCSKCGRPCRPGNPPVCGKCKRPEYTRRYNETHREDRREASRLYRALHPEEIRDYQRRWRAAHKRKETE